MAMMAVTSMADDALPETRTHLASYAALIDLQDASPVGYVEPDNPSK